MWAVKLLLLVLAYVIVVAIKCRLHLYALGYTVIRTYDTCTYNSLSSIADTISYTCDFVIDKYTPDPVASS